MLPQAIEDTSRVADTKSRFTLERIFNIWKDRRIYNDEAIKKFKDVLHAQPKLSEVDSPSGKSKITVTPKLKTSAELEKKPSDAEKSALLKRKKNSDVGGETAVETASKVFKKSLREEVLKELAVSDLKTPESLELVGILQELEKSASSDAVIREKIAELPSQVHDVNAVKNLKDKKLALEMLASVNEAAKLVDEYNSRLQQELVDRKQTALLLCKADFLVSVNFVRVL